MKQKGTASPKPPHHSAIRSKGVLVSPKLQYAFLVAIVLSWLTNLGTMLFLYLATPGAYIGNGTWTFQITQWLLPLAYISLAYSYVYRDKRPLFEKLFLAAVIGVSALITFEAIASIENTLRIRLGWFMSEAAGPGMWNAFGHDWVVMVLGLAIFAAVLAWCERGRTKKP